MTNVGKKLVVEVEEGIAIEEVMAEEGKISTNIKLSSTSVINLDTISMNVTFLMRGPIMENIKRRMRKYF